MTDPLETIRATLREKQQAAGIHEYEQAQRLGLSIGGFNKFMLGQRQLGVRAMQAIVATYPDMEPMLHVYLRSATTRPEAETATPTSRR